MNKTLFWKEMKSTLKITLIFALVLTLYVTIIISMFDPALGESLAMMAESMPEIFAAVGMLNDTSTLIAFLSTYLYGFLLIVFPLVCMYLLVRSLLVRYLDNGSMAYLLATPNSRNKILTTQIGVLVCNLLLLLIYIVFLAIGTSEVLFPGELDIQTFINLNVGLFGLWIFLAALCFSFVAFFSGSPLSYIGIGACILFILMQMITEVGEFKVLEYINPLQLFKPAELIASNSSAYLNSGILGLCGIALFIASIFVFRKRDLSI